MQEVIAGYLSRNLLVRGLVFKIWILNITLAIASSDSLGPLLEVVVGRLPALFQLSEQNTGDNLDLPIRGLQEPEELIIVLLKGRGLSLN